MLLIVKGHNWHYFKMNLVLFFVIFSFGICSSQYYTSKPTYPDSIGLKNDALVNSDMVMAFVVFRHGDRTPDQEELNKFPALNLDANVFYPYGKKALTNKGKQRAYQIGKYLRERYDGLISKLYLPEEVHIQTTDFARTKMTALVALSSLYPPVDIQKWNTDLDWQPIPYDTPQRDEDTQLHFSNCKNYLKLKNDIYNTPELQPYIETFRELFDILTNETGHNIKRPVDVFFLDNLFQTLNNVDVIIPQWAKYYMPMIKEMTKIEYGCMYFTDELIRLSGGGLLYKILNATNAKISGNNDQPKLFIYSGHENNVAALLAATRVFYPHQPNYGSTASLELWRDRVTGKYGFMVVYAAEAGGPPVVLPVNGCGGASICDYETFVKLTSNYVLPQSEYKKRCLSFASSIL